MGIIWDYMCGANPTTFEEFKGKVARLESEVSSGTVTAHSRFVNSMMPETGRDKNWLEYVARDADGKILTKLVEPASPGHMYSGMYGYGWGAGKPDEEEDALVKLARERAEELGFDAGDKNIRHHGLWEELASKYFER